jgi:hypothetical protein
VSKDLKKFFNSNVAEPEPHRFGEAGALTRFGSINSWRMMSTGDFKKKMSQTVSVFIVPIHNQFNHTNSEDQVAQFCLFSKSWLTI